MGGKGEVNEVIDLEANAEIDLDPHLEASRTLPAVTVERKVTLLETVLRRKRI